MDTAYRKWIQLGALVTLAGFMLSGPVAAAFVSLVAPQPEWASADTFVQHYHPVQQMPYIFGMVLLAGWIIMMSAHWLGYQHVTPGKRLAMSCAMGMTVMFCTLIFFNYITQLVFVHQMATHYKPELADILPVFTMVNPASLSWTIEMWGYALLGGVTWLLQPVYRDHRLLRWLLPANFFVSLISAVWVMIDAGWVLQRTGIILYGLWNALMVLILLCLYYYHRGAMRTEAKLIA
jgi:hypothetical protein